MKKGGRVPWSVTAIFETYKISCLMEKHLTKGDSANHSKGPVIPYGSWQVSPYHLLQNNYSFDALQAYCFRINMYVMTVIFTGGDFFI